MHFMLYLLYLILLIIFFRNTLFMNFNSHTNYFNYSFFPHIIALWNGLPSAVTSSLSLTVFKIVFVHYSLINHYKMMGICILLEYYYISIHVSFAIIMHTFL